ncbi:hypothetical protein OIU79_011229 [Salix purpurea]|uniref:Uncharacterized protein n=1 Tax=Salix purpurea TaxID=77065 RepID=A0A9Q0Q0M9_SALPP|nr:hypothetical protein OIU79_011229 [Salix purpurea]
MLTVTVAPAKISYLRSLPLWPSNTTTRRFVVNCIPPLQQQVHEEQQQVTSEIMCETCNGKGWLLCDFCKGLKTNVQADNKRLYRRCPSCRAIGYVLCSKCKVFNYSRFKHFDCCEELMIIRSYALPACPSKRPSVSVSSARKPSRAFSARDTREGEKHAVKNADFCLS